MNNSHNIINSSTNQTKNKFKNLILNRKRVRIILFTIACILYANIIPNKWAIDDSIVVQNNSFVKRGINGIDSVLTQETFYGFYKSNINAVAGSRWRPLSLVLFCIEAELFADTKKDANQNIEKDAAGFKIKDLSPETIFPNILHLTNVILFGILCIVLYNLISILFNPLRLTENVKGNFIAAITAFIFAIHPLHTEVVANVKSCDEILALLFALLTLYVVVRFYHTSQKTTAFKNKLIYILLSSLLYFLALLSKESSITFLAVIPLALWFFTSCKPKRILSLTLPFILTFTIYLGLRHKAIGVQKKAVLEELMNDPFLVLDAQAQYAPITKGSSFIKLLNPNAQTFTQMPLSNKLATNFYTYGIYLKLLTFPYPLTSDYYPRHITVKSFSNPFVMLSFAIHVFLLIWALRQFKKKNAIAFAILYYLCTLSIVSNMFFNIGTNMSERFMFMPSVGFCMATACLLYGFIEKLQAKHKESRANKLLIIFAFICVAGMCATTIRNTDWKDNFTLFSHDVHISTNSAKINMDLASIYLSKAIEEETKVFKESEDMDASEKKQALRLARQQRDLKISKAFPLLRKALEIHPLSGTSWFTLSKAFHFLGQTTTNDPKTNYNYLRNAIAAYEQADYYKSFNMEKMMNNHRSLCYLDMGKLVGEKFGNINESISYLEKSKQLTPEESETYFLLGTAYSMQGNFELALENTKKSLELRPNDPVTKENLAVLYQQYALRDETKSNFLVTAEKLLLEVDAVNKKMDDNDLQKAERIKRTNDLLIKNNKLQGNKMLY